MTDNNLQNVVNPYKDEGLNKIYQILFCDRIDRYKTPELVGQFPWAGIFKDSPDPDELQKIIDHPHVETRPKILAYRRLAEIGKPSSEKELLGIVVEVALDEGLDTLAAYKDGTARYINHSEKIIIWDVPTPASKKLTKKLFGEGKIIVKKIGPWEHDRLPAPQRGYVRITLLVGNELYFGEGPTEVLFNDPIGKAALGEATMLLQYLTKQANWI
jgi:hypothetical protein